MSRYLEGTGNELARAAGLGAMSWQYKKLFYGFCTSVLPGLSTEMVFSIRLIIMS